MIANKNTLIKAFLTAVLSLALVLGSMAGSAAAKEYLIGLQCDRSGPTQTVGPNLCPGFHDYISLFNKDGKLPGHTIGVMEIDHGYNVPRAIEAYERHKQAGVVSIGLYGTPHTVALTPKLTEDRILGTSPGFGSAAGANGERFPYLFPAAASYWSQAASGIKFAADKLKESGKNLRGAKIAYIYYDNPAGREPLPILTDLQKQLGFELREFAVPPPAIEMRPQVLDISRKYRADFVLSHLFGRGPGVSLKEFTRVGFDREKMIGFTWAGGESDINIAGWEQSEGYYNMQFAHVGSSRTNLNHPLLKRIADNIRAEGKELPEAMDQSVYYNRGVMIAAVHAEAIRAAVASNGPNIDGEDVKNAMERIKGLDLDGFIAPMTFTPQDHEGGGFIRIFQIHNNGYRPASDWIQGYRDTVMKHVMAGS